jgi:TetR/AcrR family transcriptional regulator
VNIIQRASRVTADPPLNRRERLRERNRQEMLEAAEALLLAHGIDGTTMEEIARRSEFSVGSLYRFFASKEDLVEALIAARAGGLAQRITDLAAAPRPFSDLFDELMATWADEMAYSYPLFRFLFSGARRLPLPEEPSPLRDCVGEVVQAVSTLLERGVRDGALDGVEPRTMALVLLSLLDGLARTARMGGEGSVHPLLPVVRRVFFDGFRRRAG